MSVEHEIREEGGAKVVAFEGDIDLDGSPEARKVLLECIGGDKPVLVDLSKVGYIDSSGVASLVESFQKARKKGCAFALVSASEAVMRVLQLARLDKVFPIYDSVEEALAGIE
ncbi:MAG: STAS domain-containing protein [Rhodospirillales bacterium]